MPAKGIKIGEEETDVISSLLFSIPFSAVSTIITFLFYRMFTGRKGAERILPCFGISGILTVLAIYSSTAIIYTNTFKLSFGEAGRMLGTIIGAPVTDPYFRTEFISYGLYSIAAVIAVTLIYSLIFDTKKPTQTDFIPFGSNAVEDDFDEEVCDGNEYLFDGDESLQETPENTESDGE